MSQSPYGVQNAYTQGGPQQMASPGSASPFDQTAFIGGPLRPPQMPTQPGGDMPPPRFATTGFGGAPTGFPGTGDMPRPAGIGDMPPPAVAPGQGGTMRAPPGFGDTGDMPRPRGIGDMPRPAGIGDMPPPAVAPGFGGMGDMPRPPGIGDMPPPGATTGRSTDMPSVPPGGMMRPQPAFGGAGDMPGPMTTGFTPPMLDGPGFAPRSYGGPQQPWTMQTTGFGAPMSNSVGKGGGMPGYGGAA